MEDKKIICKDCGKEFVFTVGEQEFFKEKGFENDPVRCPDELAESSIFFSALWLLETTRRI